MRIMGMRSDYEGEREREERRRSGRMCDCVVDSGFVKDEEEDGAGIVRCHCRFSHCAAAAAGLFEKDSSCALQHATESSMNRVTRRIAAGRDVSSNQRRLAHPKWLGECVVFSPWTLKSSCPSPTSSFTSSPVTQFITRLLNHSRDWLAGSTVVTK